MALADPLGSTRGPRRGLTRFGHGANVAEPLALVNEGLWGLLECCVTGTPLPSKVLSINRENSRKIAISIGHATLRCLEIGLPFARVISF